MSNFNFNFEFDSAAATGILGLMGRRKAKTDRAKRRKQGAAAPLTTRQRLLEAAGQVFADRGFSAATGKEICHRAKVNSASINYYFGGIAGLYEVVLQEARDRVVTTEEIIAAAASQTDASAKLEAVLTLPVRAITGPAASSWAVRVLGREAVTPSPLAGSLWENLAKRVRVLKGIVAELTGLPEDHPTVARGCISVIGPCLMLLIFNRRTFQMLYPDFDLSPEHAPALVRHLVHFALAGLRAVAEDARS